MKFAGWIVALTVVTGCMRVSATELRDGDIVFHVSQSNQSKAIQLVTKSPYSHMGIVYVRDGNVDVGDAIYTLSALFQVGEPGPPPPSPTSRPTGGPGSCGEDPTDDNPASPVFGDLECLGPDATVCQAAP